MPRMVPSNTIRKLSVTGAIVMDSAPSSLTRMSSNFLDIVTMPAEVHPPSV